MFQDRYGLGLAYQYCAELRLAHRPEELGIPATGHVLFQRLLVVAKGLNRQLYRGKGHIRPELADNEIGASRYSPPQGNDG